MNKEGILKLLKGIEWSGRKREDFGHGDYSTVWTCPYCHAVNYWDDERYPKARHLDNCELNNLIIELSNDSSVK